MSTTEFHGGETLAKAMLDVRSRPFHERVALTGELLGSSIAGPEAIALRKVGLPADRQVTMHDAATGVPRPYLVFGSNNYLGLANHPHVLQRVREAIDRYGVGVGSVPLLGGYSPLHAELEERLAAFNRTEAAILFGSGYGTNIGLVSTLVGAGDVVVSDEFNHASFQDGVRTAGARAFFFRHNDAEDLASILDGPITAKARDIFVGIEGVYSMEGDVPPLDRIHAHCKRRGAMLIVDDAHGTGVLGPKGRGVAEQFGLEGQIDLVVGTLSKTLALSGGYVAASRPIIDHLRIFARAYMFSSSLPPVVVAGAIAGLDVLEREPDRVESLWRNIRKTAAGLQALGLPVRPDSAILSVLLPPDVDVVASTLHFQRAGILVNGITYPAVPVHKDRFRLGIMATHTDADIDRLLTCMGEVLEARSPR